MIQAKSKSFVMKWSANSLLLCAGLLSFWPGETMAANDPLSVVQQSQKFVKGQVVNENDEPIFGATIKVVGTKTGAVTDLGGNFSVAAKPGAQLEISYLGYETVQVAASANMRVQLKESSESLNEVVVVGYGTMRKRDLTGAVAQIRPDKVANETPNTVQDLLRGTAGLSIGYTGTAKGGGSMMVRGQRSVYTSGDHNAPLIVLDGMIFYGELSEINPTDIDRIDVLKDASSAAVYGAKAANGVIIVTTKKGSAEKPTINFSANVGFETIGQSRHPLDADDYLKYREDFYTTDTYGKNADGTYSAYATGKPAGYYARPTQDNLTKYGLTLAQWRAQSDQASTVSDDEVYASRLGLGVSDVTLKNFLAGKTFDWYKHSFQTGINQDYNLSVSGMSKRVNYYFSVGYMNNEGVARGDEYTSVRSNLKLNANVTNWLSLGANINFQSRTDGDIATDWREQILDNSPFSFPYDETTGELVAHPMGETAYWKGYNFDYNRQYLEQERGYYIFNTIFDAKVKLPFDITYSFNAAPRFQFYHNRYYQSSEHPDWSAADHDRVTREQSYRIQWSLNNTINWDHVFNKVHHFTLTLVQEAEQKNHWQDDINARNILPTESLTLHATANGDKTLSDFSSSDDKESATGYLARLFYCYDNRYAGTFSFRRDGYSAFGTSNPYANFFSGALAWTFTNEKFFNWKPMSYGKLRLSFGQNGNRALANSYVALANLALGQYTMGYISNSGSVNDVYYLFVDRLANPHLQWEKTTSWNAGLDFGFLDNRINGSFEYYYMPTTDMIMNQSLPSFTGFTSITTNLGRVVNKGVELTINSANIRTKDFEWNTTVNFSYNHNEIKKLYGEYETTTDADGNVTTKEKDDISNGWFIGKPITAIWDYKVTGIWQKDEADEAAKYGQKPGDPKVENSYTADDKVNADGTTTPVYNNNDKQFLGQTASPYRWSMRNTLCYKNFEFSVNMYSAMGGRVLSTQYLNQDNNYSQITNCRNVYQKEYWTVDNPTNEYARINAQGPTGIEAPGKTISTSFIRLENISIAYTLPKVWIKRVGMQNVKVYANVRNVATWCHEWEYGDPETSDGLSPRTYTLGINVTL